MGNGYPGDMSQDDIEEQLFQDFLAQVTPGTPAPVIIPQATAELLLRLIDDSGGTDTGGTAPATIGSLSPVSSNTASQNISVRGSGFTPQSIVVFDGTEMGNTMFKSTILVQSMVAAPPGVYNVLVRDIGGDSNVKQFTFK